MSTGLSLIFHLAQVYDLLLTSASLECELRLFAGFVMLMAMEFSLNARQLTRDRKAAYHTYEIESSQLDSRTIGQSSQQSKVCLGLLKLQKS